MARHPSEMVFISAAVYFAKKKRIIRYLTSLHDRGTNFLWFYTILTFSGWKYKKIKESYGSYEGFDQCRSLQPSIEREWRHLKESTQTFSITGLSFLAMSAIGGPEYRSLWVVALLSYQMGAIILYNLSLSSLFILSEMWATEKAFQKELHFQPAIKENSPIFPKSNLPQELEQTILSYVDLKTLIRGRLISKSWHDAIALLFHDRASHLDRYFQGGYLIGHSPLTVLLLLKWLCSS